MQRFSFNAIFSHRKDDKMNFSNKQLKICQKLFLYFGKIVFQKSFWPAMPETYTRFWLRKISAYNKFCKVNELSPF